MGKGAEQKGAGAATLHVLPIRIQDLWLALDTTQVEQILGERTWLKVPAAPPQWPGVLAWRGRAVAVLDLGLLLGLPPLQAGSARRRTLIVRARACLLALPVDEVHEAQIVGETLIRPRHATHHPHAQSEVVVRDTIMPLFDPAQLVAAALAQSSDAADPDRDRTEPIAR